MPRVTAGIPVYNHERYVEAAIQSVIDQDYENLELIVINDGSRDGSHAVIESMRQKCDARFRRFLYIKRENRGLSRTLNEMLEWSGGEYVEFLASDDLWLPHKTSLQVSYLSRHPDTVGLYANARIINAEGTVFDDRIHPACQYGFADILEHRHFLLAPSNMLRAADLKAIGGYDPQCWFEDWDMQLRMTHGTTRTFHVLQDVVCAYRRHEGNMSRHVDLMHRDRLKLVGRYRDHERFRAAQGFVYLIAAEALVLAGRRWDAWKLLPRAMASRKDAYFRRVIAKCILPVSVITRLRRNKEY